MEPEEAGSDHRRRTGTTSDGPGERRRVALLLIHGMGEQQPFGLTDLFARKLSDLIRPETKLSHQIEPGHIEDSPDSFVRLTAGAPATGDGAAELEVDLHEVYWADKPQGLIKLKEVGKWLWWTSLTPLRRWAQSASLFHNPGGPGPPWRGAVRFLREAGLALVLPILGIALFAFAVNGAFLTDSYVDSVGAKLGAASFSIGTYLLGIAWVSAMLGGLFLVYGGVGTWRAVRYEKSLAAPDPSEYGSRWRWMLGWSLGSVGTGLGLLGVAYLVHGGSRVKDLASIVLRLGDEPLSLVLLTAASLVLVISVFVVLVVLLWRLPWEGWWWRSARVLGVLAGLAGVFVAVALLLARYDQPARVAVWAALLGGAAMLSTFLVSSIGDVAIYFDGVDERSRHYETRQSIISTATQKLFSMLTSYNEVFVVAHSLGSVIAYDAINRLATHQRVAMEGGPPSLLSETDFDHLKGLYSFGSPLDKVVYLFHKTTESRTPVLSQLQSSLTSFRRLSSGRPYGPYEFQRYQPQTPDGFMWRNAWSWGDVLGHRLDFYDVDGQPHFDYVPLVAHVSFWKDEEFYEDLVEFLGV